MVKLIFISPDFEGQTCELPEGRTTIGRGPANRLIVQHKTISADHCEILVHGPEVIVREHGSSNGSWVDGVKIDGQMPVRHGQRIRLGAVEARLEMPTLPPADENSEISAVHSHVRAVREATMAKKLPQISEPMVIKPNLRDNAAGG